MSNSPGKCIFYILELFQRTFIYNKLESIPYELGEKDIDEDKNK